MHWRLPLARVLPVPASNQAQALLPTCTLTAVPLRPVILLSSRYFTARGMFQELGWGVCGDAEGGSDT
jgi:hypothetical protein